MRAGVEGRSKEGTGGVSVWLLRTVFAPFLFLHSSEFRLGLRSG